MIFTLMKEPDEMYEAVELMKEKVTRIRAIKEARGKK